MSGQPLTQLRCAVCGDVCNPIKVGDTSVVCPRHLTLAVSTYIADQLRPKIQHPYHAPTFDEHADAPYGNLTALEKQEAVVQRALNHFWYVVTYAYPEAAIDDLASHLEEDLQAAAERAVKGWVEQNIYTTPTEEEVVAALLPLVHPDEQPRIMVEHPGYIEIRITDDVAFGFWGEDDWQPHVKDRSSTEELVVGRAFGDGDGGTRPDADDIARWIIACTNLKTVR